MCMWHVHAACARGVCTWHVHVACVQVISNNASLLAPLAVDAMLSIIDPKTATNVDLRDIAVSK